MSDRLRGLVRAQARGCATGGSTLYGSVLAAVDGDLAAGPDGPCGRVLARFADEPRSEAAVLRFLAAVHQVVLAGDAPALATHYPSAGGTPGPDVGDAFVATVAEHHDRVVELTALPIQTNEVGRSAALVGGLAVVAGTGLGLRLVEPGASAGLNTRIDRYRYETGGRGLGPVDAAVRFVDPWGTGPTPRLDVDLPVVERRACDRAPLDPLCAEDGLRLRACLWPDQPERRRRLDAALGTAAEVDLVVERARAGDWMAEQLATPVPGTVTVVMHSIVAQYLDADERDAMVGAIAAAGEQATRSAPVAWLRMEPASEREAEVRLTLWPEPAPVRTHVLARCGFHGPPVSWR